MADISYINYVLEPSKITVYGIKKYSIKKLQKMIVFKKTASEIEILILKIFHF